MFTDGVVRGSWFREVGQQLVTRGGRWVTALCPPLRHGYEADPTVTGRRRQVIALRASEATVGVSVSCVRSGLVFSLLGVGLRVNVSCVRAAAGTCNYRQGMGMDGRGIQHLCCVG